MNDYNSFPWNDNQIVNNHYNSDNYKIVTTNAKGKKAVIFFSSNGIYYPNTVDEFIKKIEKKDYYDWKNIAKHRRVRKYFSKIIFVRDIYKQWYVTGINSDLNNVDKLVDFLSEELNGYDITVCGSSAGGYMAVLSGILLNAERIICNSGQFDLGAINNPGPFVEKYKKDGTRNKYYDIKPIIKEKCEKLYYFYPARSEIDIKCNNHVKDLPIKRFATDAEEHGQAVKALCYPYLLTMATSELDTIYERYIDSMIGLSDLYCEVVPINVRMAATVRQGIKRIIYGSLALLKRIVASSKKNR